MLLELVYLYTESIRLRYCMFTLPFVSISPHVPDLCDIANTILL